MNDETDPGSSGASDGSLWDKIHPGEITLLETFVFLHKRHRTALFPSSVANFALCSWDLPAMHRWELASAVAHYIAGVLNRDSMISAVDSLWQFASLSMGDRVQTMRGTTRGFVTRILEDGCIAWRPEGATLDLIALPESLLPLDQG